MLSPGKRIAREGPRPFFVRIHGSRLFLYCFSMVLSIWPKFQVFPFAPSPYCTVMGSPCCREANSSVVKVNVTTFVEPSSPRRGHGEEIHRRDGFAMVLQEGEPAFG